MNDLSSFLTHEKILYKPCTHSVLGLTTLDELPCVIRDVLNKYPSIPKPIARHIMILGVSKMMSNTDLEKDYFMSDFAKELDQKLKSNHGNWIEIIFDKKSRGSIQHHQVMLFLYQAVYHYNLKITKEPLFAFRNTVEYSDEIEDFVKQFDCVDEEYPHRLVYTTETALCNVARELVDTGKITGTIRFIEKLKPSLQFS